MDERFHALVAKNLLDHPFTPMLYADPVTDMAYDRWDRSIVWLHKQPLFLYQIALSFKIFGISEYSLRLPDVIMGTVMVIGGYRIGKLLVNPRVGFLTGMFMLTNIYWFELISGRKEIDHNDFAFLFYISLSIWGFVEYHHSVKKKWIILTGLFAGFAVLCKWLVGLLVYSGWSLLKIQEKKFRLKEIRDLVISLLVTVVVALPWQIYTFIRFPEETKAIHSLNAMHLFKTIDGHEGTFWYYFGNFDLMYGKMAPFLIIPAFLVLYRQSSSRKIYFSLLGMVIITYLFYSISATKMPSFPVITSMLVLLAFATLLDFLLNQVKRISLRPGPETVVFVIAVIMMIALNFNIEGLQEKHTLWKKENRYTAMLSHNKSVFTSLELPENAVIFNVKGRHYIECMFYTGLPSYGFIPDQKQYSGLKEHQRVIAVFTPDNGNVPAFLLSDPEVIWIHEVIEGYQ